MKIAISLFIGLTCLFKVAPSEDLTAARERAEQGDAHAQSIIGAACEKDGNYAEAVRWYRRAAEQEDDVAQYMLGGMYEQGKGVAQDYAQAVRWWRKSAEQGNAEAPFNLGVMYATGRGVPQNYVQAYMWATLAMRASGKSQRSAASLRDVLASKMAAAQISEAQHRANVWKPTPGRRGLK